MVGWSRQPVFWFPVPCMVIPGRSALLIGNTRALHASRGWEVARLPAVGGVLTVIRRAGERLFFVGFHVGCWPLAGPCRERQRDCPAPRLVQSHLHIALGVRHVPTPSEKKANPSMPHQTMAGPNPGNVNKQTFSVISSMSRLGRQRLQSYVPERGPSK